MDRSTKNSMLGDTVGFPLAFICLDSRSRVSILRGIDRAIEAGWGGGFVFYRYGGRSKLVPISIVDSTLFESSSPRPPAIHVPFLLFSRLLVPRPLCLLFRRGLNRGLFTVKGTFVDPPWTVMARNADNGVCAIFAPYDDKL